MVGKCDLIYFLGRTCSDTNVIETQECYNLSSININLQPKDKETFRSKS